MTSFAAPFAIADFRRLQLARLATIIATQAQGTAVAWDVLERTHRPLDLGYVGLAQFAPIAGPLARRWSCRGSVRPATAPRRRVLRFRARVRGSLRVRTERREARVADLRDPLPPRDRAQLRAARVVGAVFPDIVPTELFERAVALSSSMWQGATVVGPILGGLVVAAAGAPAVFAVASVMCVVSAIMVSRMESRPARARERGVTLSSVLAGVRYVWSNQLILGSISLDLFAVLLGGATALLPVFADLLHTGSWGLGFLRAAPGVGAALSGLALARKPLERHAGAIMFACVAGFGLATIGFALSRSFALSLIMLFLTGATDMVSVVVRQTLLQIRTPPEMRGRVSAVNLVFVGASNELGEFESGLTAQWWTARVATLVGGVGTLVVVALGLVVFPDLRDVDRLKRQLAT